MICQVNVDSEGGVTVVVDSDEALDEDQQRLQGLALDDMLDRASTTAITTWLALRANDNDSDTGDGGDGE